jgi:PmbA protein
MTLASQNRSVDDRAGQDRAGRSNAGPGSLLGEDVLWRLAEPGASLPGVAAEVVVLRTWGGLTRFANSQIHQNVWTEDVLVNVRVATAEGRVGVAGAHVADTDGARGVARDALDIARMSPVDPTFPGVAPPADIGSVPVDLATVAVSPQERAAAVRSVLAEVPSDLEAAGAYTTNGAEILVATTAGQRAYSPVSQAQLNVVVMGRSSSGWAEAGGRSVAEVDPEAVARRAVDKCRAGGDPGDVEAGTWPVVLEPAATGALVEFLAYLGFGAREHLEQRSFAAGRLGEQVLDEQVTIVDDARSPATIGSPVDLEGTPAQRVELVQGGVLAGIVHDRFTAARMGASSTGHALMAPNPEGPIATHPMLLPGDGGAVEDLVAGTERGLLVTRFHYTNVVHPVETSVTGMTRDGTFLIEEGRITKAVRNLRFTQSIVAAFQAVDAISSETRYASELFPSGSRQPAVRLPAFSFTGTTTF